MLTFLSTFAFIVIGVTTAIVLLFWRFIAPKQRLGFAIVILGITALGATVGMNGGFSRVGAVGQIMSAVLGLVGGLVVWLFAVDKSKGPVASVVVLALSLSIFIGYDQGVGYRAYSQTYIYWRDNCVSAYIDGDIHKDPGKFALIDPVIGELCAEIFKKEMETFFNE